MADQNKYTLPIGINPQDFFEGITAIDKGITDLESGVTDANKGMQDAFNKSVVAGEKLELTLAGNIEQAKILRDAARAAGKDISNALSPKGSGKELENQISKFQTMLLKATKGSKISLDIVFNEATIRELQKGLKGASAEMDHFKNLVAAAKVQLASLDPQSADFASLANQISITEGFMEGLGEAQVETEGRARSLRGQLRALKDELSRMEEAGLEGTQRFEELSIAAGQLEDQIGDTAQRVRVLASDTKHIDAAIQGVTGLIGAMTAAQGAQALFGDENEELNKSIQRVTAAMAILQGVQAVANALNKDSALSILFLSGAREADVVATEAQTVATVAEAGATEVATVATEGFTAALLANPLTAIIVVLVAAAAAVYAYAKSNDDAAESVERTNKALEEQQKLLDLDMAAINRNTALNVASAQLRANSEEEVIRIEGQGLIAQRKRQEELNDFYRFKLNTIQARTDEELKLYKDFQEKLTAGEERTKDINNQIDLKGIALQKQRVEDRKAVRDEIIKLTNDLRDAQIAGLDDSTIRGKANAERAQARADANERITELQNQILRSQEAEELRSRLIVAIRKELSKKLRQITEDEKKETQQLELSAAKTIIDQARENQEDLAALRELDLRALAVEEQEKLAVILESYKGNKKLQDGLTTSLFEFIANKRKALNLKFAQEEADQQEQIQLATVNMLFGFKELPVQIEEEKQRAILRVQIEGEKKRLQALIDAGKTQGDVAVILAKEQIKKLEDALDSIGAARGSKQSIFSILGLSLTPEEESILDAQIAAIQNGINQIAEAYKQMTSIQAEQTKRQIEDSDKRIAAFDKEIDSLQSQFDKEQELRTRGLANNAAYYADQIALQKKAKDDELKNREELFEKQKAIQRQQLIADTISQGSSLITASANVIEGFSTIPIVGVPLGLIAVGAMIAGFVASKIAAFNAINSQKQSFGEGGTVDGKSHAEGGKKYIAVDGSGMVTELESGEEVIRKKQASKYRALLKAINNDSISGASDLALAELFRGTGVSFQTDMVEEGTKANAEFETAHSAVFIATSGRIDNTAELKSIRQDVGYLADRKRNEVEIWEDAFFIYEKRGNTTTKTAKP